jgi:hypothetical protein
MVTSPPQNTLMGLPTELRLSIIEHYLHEETSHNFKRSSNPSSGESLFQLWRRLFLLEKLYKIDTQTYHMTRWGLWSCLSNISTPCEPCVYRPRVPAILQTNQTLGGESRAVYLKFAREQMIVHEARHRELLPLFIDGYEAWKIRPYTGPGKPIGHGENELRVEGLELATLCFRWFALKEICEVLEGKGGAAGVDAGGQ